MRGKKTILLIEDDLPIIDIYRTALEKTGGFKVEAITLGSEAIKMIRGINENKIKKPDLILLDIILPDMNGLQVLEEIRKQKATRDLPVFILTNYGDKELKKVGIALKAERYITKTDCPPTKLVELVKKRLKGVGFEPEPVLEAK